MRSTALSSGTRCSWAVAAPSEKGHTEFNVLGVPQAVNLVIPIGGSLVGPNLRVQCSADQSGSGIQGTIRLVLM
jgi:hypothetical protein